MSDLLNKAVELGSNGEYGWGKTGQDTDGNGKSEYDCSGLITAAMRALGYNIPGRLSTSSILANSKGLFEVVNGGPQQGDLLVYDTANGRHVVIVDYYDANKKKWRVYNARGKD